MRGRWRGGYEGLPVETNSDKMNNDKKSATAGTSDARDAPTPGGETRETRPATGAPAISKGTHDEAIEEAVEDIHG